MLTYELAQMDVQYELKMIANQFEVEYVVEIFARYFDKASKLGDRNWGGL